MLLSCWRLLQRSLWPLVVAHGVTDTLVFLLHRLSHRATNEVAVRLLGGGLLTPAAIGNMWWLNTDPAIANFKTGYQLLTFAFFLLAFPLNVAIKTWASCATILLCRRAQQQPGEAPWVGPAPWWNVRRGLRQAFGTLRSINGEVAALWRPVFIVELLVAAVVVPAQFASLAVITLPFTLPLIVELQAAGPAAALEGVRGTAAMERSRALLRGLRWQLAVPFVGLVVAGRLLEGAKATLLSNMPPRFYQELVELPLLVLVGGTLLSILLARMQDVLPMVAYSEGKQAEAVAAAQAGASQGASNGASGKGSQGASSGASGGDGGSK
ncbi:hypothetical protein ABPG77_004511 [Micractinium sp. CCAP 211/92]